MVNACIIPGDFESIDETLRRFRKALERHGTMREYRDHESFTSKPEKRRSKRNAAIARRNGGRLRART
jgi:ribosomal protein S21